jgi:hypothetical protein
MHWCIGKAQGQGQTQADDKSHPDADDANNGEIQPYFQRVQPAQHENSVDEHDEVATSHKEAIKQNGIGTDIAKAAAPVHMDLNTWEAGVQADLDELCLPGQGEGIRMFELHSAALTGHLLDNIWERHIPVQLSRFCCYHMPSSIVHFLTQKICNKEGT